jgi:hypothetical protein
LLTAAPEIVFPGKTGHCRSFSILGMPIIHSPAKEQIPDGGPTSYHSPCQEGIPASGTPGFDLPVNDNAVFKFKRIGIILGKCYGM